MIIIKQHTRRPASSLLIITFLIGLINPKHVSAQDAFISSGQKSIYSTKGSEYISGQEYNRPMMKVRLLGTVAKPGVHIIPNNSSMTGLLSYAGGTSEDSDVENIKIKRKKRKQHEILNFNLIRFIDDNKMNDFKLRPNDIVYVPKKDMLISKKTQQTLLIISSIMGILVSSVIIKNQI